MADRQNISSGSPFESTIGFSRAVRIGNRVVVSGTAPIWPDGSCDPDPAVQARRCFEIALEALSEAGARPEDVIRTRVYLTDREYGEAASAAHGEIFSDIRPATAFIIVAGFLDPRWKIEIEVEASVQDDNP